MSKVKEKAVPVMVRIPEDLLKKVDHAASRDERSRSYVVIDALRRRYGRRSVAKGGAA